ncbi:MAG: cornichon [Piptocephalis tieghemiana]|nr:MAG: cornichon [Piptocephalis tieghemiana]
MNLEAVLFLLAVLIAAALLFGMVFYIIMFSDLECDYINPIDLCNKLNAFILPEYAIQTLLLVLFLLTGSWTAMFLNLPVVGWNFHKLSNKRHIYDPTDIFRTLGAHKTESFVKLGFYLICFFYYLYRMILGLIADD